MISLIEGYSNEAYDSFSALHLLESFIPILNCRRRNRFHTSLRLQPWVKEP